MRPLSILVVDDHEPTQHVLELWLEAHGHHVVCAGGGHAALDTLHTTSVDLVITDVLMPDGDGIELIAQIKKTQPKLRVLAISGGGAHFTSSSCLHRAHSVGAHALLLKPFHQDQLISAMRYVLGIGDDAAPGAAQLHGRARTPADVRVFPGFPAEDPLSSSPQAATAE